MNDGALNDAGLGPEPAAKPNGHAAPSVQAAVDGFLSAPVTVFMNGAIASLSAQGVPVPLILQRIVFLIGQNVGAGVRGDLAPALRVRAEVQKAFENGVRSISPVMPGAAPPPAG
jgi:hypothetical protein